MKMIDVAQPVLDLGDAGEAKAVLVKQSVGLGGGEYASEESCGRRFSEEARGSQVGTATDVNLDDAARLGAEPPAVEIGGVGHVQYVLCGIEEVRRHHGVERKVGVVGALPDLDPGRCRCGFARCSPNDALLLDDLHRGDPEPRPPTSLRGRGNVAAFAGTIERPSVIAALEHPFVDSPVAQRRSAMGASVHHGDGALARAKEDPGLTPEEDGLGLCPERLTSSERVPSTWNDELRDLWGHDASLGRFRARCLHLQ